MEAARFWLNFVYFFRKQVSFAVFGIMAVFSLFHWRHKISQAATEHEAKALSKMYQGFQENSLSSSGHYLTDPSQLPQPADHGIGQFHAYFSKEEIPEQYRDLIPDSQAPELGQNKYRILLIDSPSNRAPSMWSVEPGAHPRKLIVNPAN